MLPIGDAFGHGFGGGEGLFEGYGWGNGFGDRIGNGNGIGDGYGFTNGDGFGWGFDGYGDDWGLGVGYASVRARPDVNKNRRNTCSL
jgi:hypothetical protein